MHYTQGSCRQWCWSNALYAGVTPPTTYVRQSLGWRPPTHAQSSKPIDMREGLPTSKLTPPCSQHRLRHRLCTTPCKHMLLPRSGKNSCQVPAHIVPFRNLGALAEAPGHSLMVYVDTYVYPKHITRGIKIGNDDQSYVKYPCCKTSQMLAHLEALVPTNFGQSSLTACVMQSVLTHVRTCNGCVPRPTLHGRTQRNDGRFRNSFSGT